MATCDDDGVGECNFCIHDRLNTDLLNEMVEDLRAALRPKITGEPLH
jgi:hypothetical protein